MLAAPFDDDRLFVGVSIVGRGSANAALLTKRTGTEGAASFGPVPDGTWLLGEEPPVFEGLVVAS